MGRRKIEITPITHERNRSVTFLKRKNGLFKKAYELGVLCSVEVAVIIFEERPGHHLKLYQYCSGDVNDVVQRHLRYDGEKDTRTPADFSGNAPNKLDDVGDGDDDDADDDDQEISRVPKRKSDGKLKPASLTISTDLEYSSSLSIAQPPLPGMGLSSSLPLSNDRAMLRSAPSAHHQHHQALKKPRLMPSRASPDDAFPGPAALPNVNPHPYSYHPQTSPTYPGRPAPNPGSRYPSFFPSQQPQPQTPPPPGFLPLQPDFMSSSPPRSSHHAAARGLGGAPGYGARGPYEPSMYHSLRGHHPHSSPHHSGANDLFAFLDADVRSQSAQPPGGYVGLDWPTSQSAPAATGAPPPPPPPSSSSSGDSWLDILSGNTGPHHPAPPPPPPPSSREPMSWERSDMFGSGSSRPQPPPSTSSAGATLLSSPLGKRPGPSVGGALGVHLNGTSGPGIGGVGVAGVGAGIGAGPGAGSGRLVSPGSVGSASSGSPGSMTIGVMDGKELMVGDVSAS
ncbi:hypothetical protein AX16_004367 [Volvariella volvacea WC 439]|nr:hypothetical protein AX16_004367 [Volvariella volvacea WC 439]